VDRCGKHGAMSMGKEERRTMKDERVMGRRGNWVRPARVLKTCLPAVVCEGLAESVKKRLRWQ